MSGRPAQSAASFDTGTNFDDRARARGVGCHQSEVRARSARETSARAITTKDNLAQMRPLAHAPSGALASSANAILLGLAPCDLRMLEPMDYVRLPARYALYAAGDALRCLYFPASAVASFVQADERGAMLETAHVGAEGVIGVTALLGAERARQRAVVRIAGGAYRVPLSAARSAFARSATF